MNQRSPSASTVEFFNTIRQKRPFAIVNKRPRGFPTVK
jgi:hypothetical protein